MFGETEGPAGLVAELDRANATMARAQRELLRLIALAGADGLRLRDGARDLGHWLSMRYGMSTWKAQRWIAAASALDRLPRLDAALSTGRLGIDKVVELARFATPEDEAELVRRANNVSCATVRRRADRAARVDHDEAREAETARSFSWWWIDEGRRLGLEGELPAAQGAIVVRAIERASTHVPLMPDEGEPWFADARRADALVALCSSAIAADPDTDRATVVHALATDRQEKTSAFTATDLTEPEIEGGAAVSRPTLERLVCAARLQLVLEDRHGEALGMGLAHARSFAEHAPPAPLP